MSRTYVDPPAGTSTRTGAAWQCHLARTFVPYPDNAKHARYLPALDRKGTSAHMTMVPRGPCLLI
jgi:hypothetical protein